MIVNRYRQTYIMLPQRDGSQLALPTNTAQQIRIAREAVRAAGLRFTAVYRGLTDEAGKENAHAGYWLPAADGTGYIERPFCDHVTLKSNPEIFVAGTIEAYEQDGVRFRNCRGCRSTLAHPSDVKEEVRT